jgi:hypothetical protein
MTQGHPGTGVSIMELPVVVRSLFERGQQPLLPGVSATPELFARYLRRKPGRGLAVIYQVDDRSKNAGRSHTQRSGRWVSLTLDETALEGARIRFNLSQVEEAPLEMQPSGVLYAKSLGISVQAFPADERLPALAACCDTSRQSVLFEALERAAQHQLQDAAWRLLSANAEPVRYKPANRCVIRYRLSLEHSGLDQPTSKKLTVFGKVYADPQQAQAIYVTQQQLYAEQSAIGQNSLWLPRPLGIIHELGLTLHEGLEPAGEDGEREGHEEPALSGTKVFRPQIVRGRGGDVSEVIIPGETLSLTAQALARLHTSRVHPDEDSPRTGAKEARRAHERAGLLASYHPAQAEHIQQFARQVAGRLETMRPDAYRLAHGGFKSSQLLMFRQRVFIVDFDGLCLADPALDLGYFLAYLRPSGLWYQRPGLRQWFEEAAAMFVAAYRQALLEQQMDPAEISGIVERSRCYEAALLFKIATRRVNRLNSPRPQELVSFLNEIAACLLE